MKPSIFKAHPMGSTLQKSKAETIARNIMVILSRTGDTFRPLSWDEYKEERKKDGNFSSGEASYFDVVIDYCKSPDTARLFSPVWEQAYLKAAKQQTPPTSTAYVEPKGFKGTKGEWNISGTTRGLNNFYIGTESQHLLQVFSSIPNCEANAKLIAQSKELAKFAQSVKDEGQRLLELYATSKDYTEADMYKLFRTGVGNWIELAKQKLSDAGLTE